MKLFWSVSFLNMIVEFRNDLVGMFEYTHNLKTCPFAAMADCSLPVRVTIPYSYLLNPIDEAAVTLGYYRIYT